MNQNELKWLLRDYVAQTITEIADTTEQAVIEGTINFKYDNGKIYIEIPTLASKNQ